MRVQAECYELSRDSKGVQSGVRGVVRGAAWSPIRSPGRQQKDLGCFAVSWTLFSLRETLKVISGGVEPNCGRNCDFYFMLDPMICAATFQQSDGTKDCHVQGPCLVAKKCARFYFSPNLFLKKKSADSFFVPSLLVSRFGAQ